MKPDTPAVTVSNRLAATEKKRRRENHTAMKSKRPAIPYLGWMLVFTIVPLVMVVYYAFTDAKGNFYAAATLAEHNRNLKKAGLA